MKEDNFRITKKGKVVISSELSWEKRKAENKIINMKDGSVLIKICTVVLTLWKIPSLLTL